MGRILALVVAASAIAACSGEAGEAGEANPTAPATFTSDVYGYSIDLPDEWSFVRAVHTLREGEPPTTGSGVTDILGREASVRVNQMDSPGVIVAAQPVAGGTDLSDWTDAVVGIVREMKDCDHPASEDGLEIGGDAAVLLTYPDCPPDLGLFHLWAVVTHKGQGFHIVWFNEPGTEDQDRRDFEALLATLSFGD